MAATFRESGAECTTWGCTWSHRADGADLFGPGIDLVATGHGPTCRPDHLSPSDPLRRRPFRAENGCGCCLLTPRSLLLSWFPLRFVRRGREGHARLTGMDVARLKAAKRLAEVASGTPATPARDAAVVTQTGGGSGACVNLPVASGAC